MSEIRFVKVPKSDLIYTIIIPTTASENPISEKDAIIIAFDNKVAELTSREARPETAGSELSTIGIITKSLELAKARKVGVQFTYFDVIELLGHIKALEEDSVLATHELVAYQSRIRELEETTDEVKKIIRDFLIGFSVDVFGVVPNGNSAFGCDEGTVRGNEYLRGLVKRAELYAHTDITHEVSVVVKNQKSLGDEVMEIIQAALSGDCQRYLNYDMQGNKYCKWGIVEKDIRALFETSTDNNKGESND